MITRNYKLLGVGHLQLYLGVVFLFLFNFFSFWFLCIVIEIWEWKLGSSFFKPISVNSYIWKNNYVIFFFGFLLAGWFLFKKANVVSVFFFFIYLFFVIFFCCLIRDIFRYLGFFCSSNYASVEQHVKRKKVSYCRAFLVFSFLFLSFLFHLFDQRQLLRLKFLAPWNCAWCWNSQLEKQGTSFLVQ